ncbi:thermonuclease family protein [Thalassospira marina]|uniref:Nuclease n=1 Tax=Thalassospira marina TaxID=2048283 RepID=A0A2N3KXS9_9PROT|nr:thermonuclease family protein [Thalassospira marina]PKR55391.1 nuclease [Thalassospira marina]
MKQAISKIGVSIGVSYALLFTPLPASAECFSWPADGLAYDGDTLAVTVPNLPAEIARISIRVRGIDAPEIRGKCESEKAQALAAREFTRKWLSTHQWQVCSPEWGKYGGRMLGDVVAGESSLANDLIAAGLARPYDGGKRQGWCLAQ